MPLNSKLPSRRTLKRWSRASAGLLEPPIQRHSPGRRGSFSILSPGSAETAAAILQARGPKGKGWSDHEGFRMWFEGVAEPPGLVDHIQKLLSPLQLGADLRRRIKRDRLDVAEDLVQQFMSSTASQRHPVVRALRKRLPTRVDVESAMTALVQMALGGIPSWDANHYRSLDDPSQLSVQELVVSALGFARQPALSPVADRHGQQFMQCDPFELPKTLRFLIKLNPISFGSALTSAPEPLTLEDLRLGRDVVRTFTVNAHAFTKSAALYYGRGANQRGSVFSLFSVFERISVNRRPDARLTAWIVVGAAVIVRAMLASRVVQCEGLLSLLSTINAAAAKCRAFIAIMESTPVEDRRYLSAGASSRLQALERVDSDRRQRLADELNGYLAAHPEHSEALGLASLSRDGKGQRPRVVGLDSAGAQSR